MDQPFSVLPFLQVGHRSAGIEFCPMVIGIGQIVHKGRILGAIVAARNAIPAAIAGKLLHPKGVDPIFEGDVDRRTVICFFGAHGLGPGFEIGQFTGEGEVIRVGGRAQITRGYLVPLFDPFDIIANCFRPAVRLENTFVGLQTDASIDQGSAAQSASLEDIDLFIDDKLVEVVFLAPVLLGAVDLDFGNGLVFLIRIFTLLALIGLIGEMIVIISAFRFDEWDIFV